MARKDGLETVAMSPDALDHKVDIGPNNEHLNWLLDQFESAEDPAIIVIRCEQIDVDEGRAIGTTLQLYFEALTITKERSK